MIRPAPIPTASLPPLSRARRVGPAGAMVARAVFALAALAALALPALAGPRLRGDVTALRDAITLGDLVEGAPADLAGQALFRAPALGGTGTIQVARVVEAARALGLEGVETGGRLQVSVARAARRITAAEIEAALGEALGRRAGLDPRGIAIVFEGALPGLVVPLDVIDPVSIADIAYDPRGRRVTALVAVGARPADARASLRVAGAVVETTEVAVVARALAKGEAVGAGDLALERRPREGSPTDAQSDVGVLGQVAKRALPVGAVVRAGDLARPGMVARGEPVLIVFETPGMSLTLRGRASEAGALGDSIAVLNPHSKKTLQATVTGPGRVAVAPAGALPAPGRLAAAR